MFRGRRQLQRRDRESGLAFNWRVPVSSTGTLASAVLLVGLIAVALATTVRVRIGGGSRGEPEHGSMVLVPPDHGGDVLERRAVEAGPFPSRWNPAADPEYVALRREALRLATASGVPYRPELVPAEVDSWVAETPGDFRGGILPQLPEVAEATASAEPLEVMLGARLLDADRGVAFGHAALPLPAASAGETVGRRFLVGYDAAGRVIDVVALAPRGRQAAVARWLSRGLVTGHAGKGGWLSVETVVAR